MQVATKTEYIISLNHEEMLGLKHMIELALGYCKDDMTGQTQELAMEILENIREQ